MESLLLIRSILVILSTCYTNGLSLSDLYPYGTEHGDTMRNGSTLPVAPLLAPIDNLVRIGPAGVTGTRYRVSEEGIFGIRSDGTANDIYLNVLYSTSGIHDNTKVYGRTTTDPVLLKRAMDQINEAFPNTFCSTSPPTQLIIATWIDFLKFDSNQGSNFQLIIVTNGRITFGIALYVNVSITSADETGIGFLINDVYEQADPSFFPFGTTVMDAPSMMLNSNIPGTYVFPLYDIPPDTCSSGCFPCKSRLVQLACEAMRSNGEDVPASCNN
ncbi:PREDICTED: uncharacterized protein LOC109587842 [Amphimedon queenslandica]|uniref:NIDO domain-containing protein n=2 Tax=Amphimedon queenslandica TaxID=400682 RepID=A0AAN0JRY6_AMPQE|nr:PREDICTED: uncharacterized protein LOC109587842 [Amphimedon queenslandica]|eukprot:XP_019859622.1 PREDICTED: uncharacterized protein LOC109587842 [Amphimedon queenslandica]